MPSLPSLHAIQSKGEDAGSRKQGELLPSVRMLHHPRPPPPPPLPPPSTEATNSSTMELFQHYPQERRAAPKSSYGGGYFPPPPPPPSPPPTTTAIHARSVETDECPHQYETTTFGSSSSAAGRPDLPAYTTTTTTTREFTAARSVSEAAQSLQLNVELEGKTAVPLDAYFRHHEQLRSMSRHFASMYRDGDHRHHHHQQRRRDGIVHPAHGGAGHNSNTDNINNNSSSRHRLSSSDEEEDFGRYVQDSSSGNSYNPNGQQCRDALRNERDQCVLMKPTPSMGSGSSSISSDAPTDTMIEFDPTISKKARRKEQCRVNQANYRKRKRMYENQLSGQIKVLEDEILELKARKIALDQQSLSPYSNEDPRGHDDPIESIGDFYYALESARLEFPPDVQLHYPVLHSLFDRQQQEFASIEGLRLQWLWYREHFDVFNLFVSSSERLDAGDQVIIRISAHLHIQMQQKAVDAGEYAARFARTLVCPVLQQFEFHADQRVLTRITSEIDWIAGVAALVQCPPEHTLHILKELADGVSGFAGA